MDISSLPETLIINNIEPYTRRTIPKELSLEINEINRDRLWDDLIEEIRNMKYIGDIENQNDLENARRIFESNGKYGVFYTGKYLVKKIQDESGTTFEPSSRYSIILGIYNENPFPIKYTISSWKDNDFFLRPIELKPYEKKWVLQDYFLTSLCTSESFYIQVKPDHANFKIYRGDVQSEFRERLSNISNMIPVQYSQLSFQMQEEFKKDKEKNFFFYFQAQVSYIKLLSSDCERNISCGFMDKKKWHPLIHKKLPKIETILNF